MTLIPWHLNPWNIKRKRASDGRWYSDGRTEVGGGSEPGGDGPLVFSAQEVLVAYQGDALEIRLTVKDGEGNPVDLSGMAVRLLIGRESVLLEESGQITDAAQGEAVVRTRLNIDHEVPRWQIIVTEGDAQVTAVGGQMNLKRSLAAA